MSNNERLMATLKYVPGVNNQVINDALDQFDPARDQDVNLDFNAVQALQIPQVNQLTDTQWNQYVRKADQMLAKSARLGVQAISQSDPNYPDMYRVLSNQQKPAILYVKGDLEKLNRKGISIVGSRETTHADQTGMSDELKPFVNTPYVQNGGGKRLTQQYAHVCVQNGFNVVGGLAHGADSFAHEQTLKDGGCTIAILAGGLDQPIYPPEHGSKGHTYYDKASGSRKPCDGLADDIVNAGGILLSEYPLGTPTFPKDEWAGQHLVDRDALQSGLCVATIAVETDIKGGTKHAMDHCQPDDQNRLLACPDASKYLGLTPNMSTTNPYQRYANYPQRVRGTQQYVDDGKAMGLSTADSVKSFFQKANQLADNVVKHTSSRVKETSDIKQQVSSKAVVSAKQSGKPSFKAVVQTQPMQAVNPFAIPAAKESQSLVRHTTSKPSISPKSGSTMQAQITKQNPFVPSHRVSANNDTLKPKTPVKSVSADNPQHESLNQALDARIMKAQVPKAPTQPTNFNPFER